MHVIKLLLKIGGWFLVGFSVVDLLITFFVYRHSRAFVETSARADGVVTKLVERAGHDSGTLYYPVFTFRDSRGENHEIFSSSGSFPPSQHVGQKVIVLYPPNSPDNAKLDDFFSLWGWPAILGAVGCGNLLMGVVFLIVAAIVQKYAHDKTTAQVA